MARSVTGRDAAIVPVRRVIPDPAQVPAFEVAATAVRWQAVKREAKVLGEQELSLKTDLSKYVEALGEPDDKGHVWLHDVVFPGFDSKGKPVLYNALQRQRRVGLEMDEEEAIAVLEKHDLLEECTTSYVQVTDPQAAIKALRAAGLLDQEGVGIEIVTSVDQDRLRDAWFNDKITEAEYRRIVTERVTWALLPGRL